MYTALQPRCGSSAKMWLFSQALQPRCGSLAKILMALQPRDGWFFSQALQPRTKGLFSHEMGLVVRLVVL
eukprot:4665809-Amphidinium_carterae.1